jgi:hypothetical protein
MLGTNVWKKMAEEFVPTRPLVVSPELPEFQLALVKKKITSWVFVVQTMELE